MVYTYLKLSCTNNIYIYIFFLTAVSLSLSEFAEINYPRKLRFYIRYIFYTRVALKHSVVRMFIWIRDFSWFLNLEDNVAPRAYRLQSSNGSNYCTGV